MQQRWWTVLASSALGPPFDVLQVQCADLDYCLAIYDLDGQGTYIPLTIDQAGLLCPIVRQIAEGVVIVDPLP